MATRLVGGVPVRVVTVDLADPATVVAVGLAGQADLARPPVPPHGEASFAALAARWPAAALVNGTFFSPAPGRPVMGTLVTAGVLANHVAWRPKGTTFALLAGNRPAYMPASTASWRHHWLSITGAPRLLVHGRIVADAVAEGITDPDVLGRATRTALGTTADGHRLLVASIGAPVSLAAEAAIMQALGAADALNLDGGTSRALAVGGRIEIAPGRPLTNVLAVFDATHPAPDALVERFRAFTGVPVGPAPLHLAGSSLDPGPFAAGRVTPYKQLVTGRVFDFEDWRFVGVGPARVRNVDGWLDLRAAGAPVFAAWQGPASPGYRLDGLVSVGAAPARVILDARPGRRGLDGLAIELAAGRPLWLRPCAGGISGRGACASDRRTLGPGRHFLRIDTTKSRMSVWLDGALVFAGRRPAPGAGLGLEGPLMVTHLSVIARP